MWEAWKMWEEKSDCLLIWRETEGEAPISVESVPPDMRHPHVEGERGCSQKLVVRVQLQSS